MESKAETLPNFRYEISEAARILRLSRATVYARIREGLLKTRKDGRRTFILADELRRYIRQG